MRRVLLTGNPDTLARLQARLHGDLEIVADRDGLALVSPEIESAPDADAARLQAEKIVELLRGAAALEWSSGDIAVGHVVDETAGGRRQVTVLHTGSITMDARIVAPGVDTTAGPVRLALEDLDDPQVVLVLRLLAQPVSFGSLYKVLDAVEEAVGGERALRDQNWVPARELRRFTQSANAIENAAGGGRHARSDYRLGATPRMTEAEGLALIRTVVTGWLDSRQAGSTSR